MENFESKLPSVVIDNGSGIFPINKSKVCAKPVSQERTPQPAASLRLSVDQSKRVSCFSTEKTPI
jgi:hypothetical protein